jgi:hypothetical protein
LNRALRPGSASILVPNQATVMLWQTVRSAATGFSIAMVGSFRRLTARKQLAAEVDAENIGPRFKNAATLAAPPRKSARQPHKTIETKVTA